jgi:hypothetical protein
MTTKERLHKLVDELTEDEAGATLDFIASRRGSKAEPGDIIDEWGNLSAMMRGSGLRMLRRMDEDEIAEYGETIAETFARAEAERDNAR